MNFNSLVDACMARDVIAIVMTPDAYVRLKEAMANASGDWNGEAMTYRGAPIVQSHHSRHSYIVEDCYDGPLFHILPL